MILMTFDNLDDPDDLDNLEYINDIDNLDNFDALDDLDDLDNLDSPNIVALPSPDFVALLLPISERGVDLAALVLPYSPELRSLGMSNI